MLASSVQVVSLGSGFRVRSALQQRRFHAQALLDGLWLGGKSWCNAAFLQASCTVIFEWRFDLGVIFFIYLYLSKRSCSDIYIILLLSFHACSFCKLHTLLYQRIQDAVILYSYTPVFTFFGSINGILLVVIVGFINADAHWRWHVRRKCAVFLLGLRVCDGFRWPDYAAST